VPFSFWLAHFITALSTLTPGPNLWVHYKQNQAQQKYDLKLKEVHGGTKENFARILEPQELPDAARMIELLHRSIQNKASIFSLNEPLPPSLAIEASKMVQDSIGPEQ
jgi:hypothetical protein